METFEITPPATHDPAALVALIERAAEEAGLRLSRAELRTYPGSTHWHLKRPGEKGTLELTYWPRYHLLRMSISFLAGVTRSAT